MATRPTGHRCRDKLPNLKKPLYFGDAGERKLIPPTPRVKGGHMRYPSRFGDRRGETPRDVKTRGIRRKGNTQIGRGGCKVRVNRHIVPEGQVGEWGGHMRRRTPLGYNIPPLLNIIFVTSKREEMERARRNLSLAEEGSREERTRAPAERVR